MVAVEVDTGAQHGGYEMDFIASMLPVLGETLALKNHRCSKPHIECALIKVDYNNKH